MSDYPGERPGQQPGDQPRDQPDDDQTRPLGWQQPEPQRGWDAPGARPQSWDAPSPDQPQAQPQSQPWTQPQPGGPQAPYGGGYAPGQVPYGVSVADHPSSNLALVLGIVGMVGGLSCGVGFVLSPFAWVVGRNALRDIRASGGHYGGEGSARAGQVLGIIGTVLLVLGILVIIAIVVFVVIGASTADQYGNV